MYNKLKGQTDVLKVVVTFSIASLYSKTDLPCPDLPGLSIHRASILSPENKLCV